LGWKRAPLHANQSYLLSKKFSRGWRKGSQEKSEFKPADLPLPLGRKGMQQVKGEKKVAKSTQLSPGERAKGREGVEIEDFTEGRGHLRAIELSSVKQKLRNESV